MLRCEGTWDDFEAVNDELTAYNPLITQPNYISTTIMFEYPTKEERESELPKLVGIDQHVWLQINLPRSEEIELAVYNLTGQKVATLAHGLRATGGRGVYAAMGWTGR